MHCFSGIDVEKNGKIIRGSRVVNWKDADSIKGDIPCEDLVNVTVWVYCCCSGAMTEFRHEWVIKTCSDF